jgi:hypothetical protein
MDSNLGISTVHCDWNSTTRQSPTKYTCRHRAVEKIPTPVINNWIQTKSSRLQIICLNLRLIVKRSYLRRPLIALWVNLSPPFPHYILHHLNQTKLWKSYSRLTIKVTNTSQEGREVGLTAYQNVSTNTFHKHFECQVLGKDLSLHGEALAKFSMRRSEVVDVTRTESFIFIIEKSSTHASIIWT